MWLPSLSSSISARAFYMKAARLENTLPAAERLLTQRLGTHSFRKARRGQREASTRGSWEPESCWNLGCFSLSTTRSPLSFWPPAFPPASVPALYFVPVSLLRQVVPNGDRWSLALGNLQACGKGTCKRPADAFLEGGVRLRRSHPERLLSALDRRPRPDFTFRVLHSNSSASTRNVGTPSLCASTALQTVGI